MIIRGSPPVGEAGPQNLEQAKVRITNNEGVLETVTLSHPWLYGNQLRICAGNISLHLMTTERVIAFTFGGDMQVHPQNGATLFVLTSPAPILIIEKFNQISTILANKVAILLAERRGEELPDLSAYNQALLCADPLELYCVCLKALKEKSMDFSHPQASSMLAFSSFLTTEIDSLKAANLWPNRLPDLVDLLSSS
jgi:hypothetical protein